MAQEFLRHSLMGCPQAWLSTLNTIQFTTPARVAKDFESKDKAKIGSRSLCNQSIGRHIYMVSLNGHYLQLAKAVGETCPP